MTRLVVAVAAALSALPLGAGAAQVVAPIQPGAKVTTPVGTCSLNFVFETPDGRRFVGTAGHCGKVGQTARSASPAIEIGPFVFSENLTAPGIDFALIAIDPARAGDVSPSVRTYGGPTGVTSPRQTRAGDVLLVTGYGVGFGASAPTRDRFGVLMADDEDEYVANLVAVNGDSGGPILHAETGRALGTISRYNLPHSTDIGPTMERILQRLRESGFAGIRLLTASYDP